MMLCKIALKNIKKSIKDYAVYFFTLVLGVSIFYVFNSIESQTVMLNINNYKYEILDFLYESLSILSVFVSVILGLLIIYASRFLIKRRNKEFGVYLTLGMSKRKVSIILFLETLFIGVISLFVGVIFGVILSQFMSLLVANIFDADMSNFKFIFSSSALIKTLIYFSIMYLLVVIFNTITVNKCELINLIYGNKKNEKVRLKNPIVCTIIFIVSVVTLGYAYYLVGDGIYKINSFGKILIPVIMGATSTFFIFWSLSGLILKIVSSFKNIYYKGLNVFVLRQCASKINTAVMSISVICLMLFVTICTFCSCFSLKESLDKNISKLTPVDIVIHKTVLDDDKSNITNIYETFNNMGLNVKDYFKDIDSVYVYSGDDFLIKDSFSDSLEQIVSEYPFLNVNYYQPYISISDYNKVARMYGFNEYELKDNEYFVIADFKNMVEIRNIALKDNSSINFKNHVLVPKFNECIDAFIDIGANPSNDGIFVVPDSLISYSDVNKNIVFGNYNASSKKDKIELEEEFTNYIENNYNHESALKYNSKIDIDNSSIGLGAYVTFIGLYLCIIFLISSAAVLALKELSEAADNADRYRILKKIGASNKMVNSALFKQIAIFFMAPLILAIIHSIFGLRFAMFVLETVGVTDILSSIIKTFIFITFIYGGYFIITYMCSKNMIKNV